MKLLEKLCGLLVKLQLSSVIFLAQGEQMVEEILVVSLLYIIAHFAFLRHFLWYPALHAIQSTRAVEA